VKNKSLFFAISKRNDAEQVVEGIASTEAVDSDGEVIEYEGIKKSLADYMEFANLREMHQLKAAGVVLEANPDDATKTISIKAKVVDKDAWEKVKEGVYKGFSIGGRALSRIGNRIKEIRLNEISLVDRPANPEALITLFKADEAGGAEQVIRLDSALGKELLKRLATPEPVTVELVEKSMDTVARLARLFQELEWLRSSVQFEEEMEQDTASRLPGLLNELCALMGETLLEMAAEEVNELSVNYATPKAGTEKGSKTMSNKLSKAQAEERFKALMAKAQKAHEDFMAKAADEMEEEECSKAWATIFSPNMTVPEQKAEGAGDLMKALKAISDKKAAKDSESTDLLKAMGDALVSLSEKVEKLSAVPMPAKAAAKPVEKAADSKPVIEGGDDLQKAISAETDPVKKAALILKSIHANGGTPIQPGARV
jgi:hypothetical protein